VTLPHLSLKTALILALGTCPIAHSVAAAPAPAVPRGVEKRLALWQRTAVTGLAARYRLTRHSSMLWDPLIVEGSLVFAAPDRLELRDDARTGATTVLARGTVTITANDPALPPWPASPPTPALLWLQDHLLALFAARDRDALLRDARVVVPRGPGQRLELSPPRTHAAAATIDHLRVLLDPDTGALLELELTLVSGDRVILELRDARPGPAPV
jgi:hypothetical protein